MRYKGIFVSLEGIDGSGKTSLMENIYSHFDNSKILCIREPGGTVISEKIRDMLLDIKNKGMVPRTEALLYMAARTQLVEEIIKPALAEGKMVLADRYMDSTIAYQGYGRGIDIDFLKTVNDLCTEGLKPQLTLLLDLLPEEGLKRRNEDKPDRLEQEGIEFQKRVREGYLEIAHREPQRIKVLDATQEMNAVAAAGINYIKAALAQK